MDRGSQLDEEDDEDDEDDKDDKEDEEEAGGRRRQEEEATDIKSNNPHLAGGEKYSILCICLCACVCVLKTAWSNCVTCMTKTERYQNNSHMSGRRTGDKQKYQHT